MAILASPRDRLGAAFGAALLCHGALLWVERTPPRTPEPAAPASFTIGLTAPLQPLPVATPAMETPPPAQEAPQPAKAAPEAKQHAKESPALTDSSPAPPSAAPSASETPPVAAPGPALSDLLAAARRYSEAPEVRRLGPATVLSPAEDAYLRGWRTRIERLGTVNFPPEARRAAERAGGQATLRLRAELFRDGRLGDLAVVIGSGDAAVDQAALTLVRSAHPYLPFPQALSRHERLEIVRDFTFRLP